MPKSSKPASKRGHSQDNLVDLSSLSQALLQSTGAGIYVAQDGKFVYVSPLAVKFSGYSEKEMLGRRCLSLVYDDDRENVRRKAIESLKNPSSAHPFEYRFVKNDGTPTWVLERVAPITYRERPATLGSFMDISEKKQIEEALLSSEQKYRTILEEMEDACYEVDLDGNYLYVNEAMCRSLLYTREELIGKNYRMVVPDEYVDILHKEFLKVHDTGVPNRGIVHKVTRKDGLTGFSESSVALLRNQAGEPIGFLCVGRDITKRQWLEKQLKRSEERFRTILERMQDSYYEIDLAGNYLYFNDAALTDLGYSREELIGKSYRLTTPETEQKSSFRAFNEVYKTGIPNKCFSHKILCKDGSIRYVESSIDLQRNERNEVIGFRSVSRDVSERKTMEEALARSEERYRTIIEQMQDSYYELDLKGRYTFANLALGRIFGYSMEELLGKDYHSFVPEDEAQKLFDAYHEVYRTGRPNMAFIHKSKRRDGTIIFLESTIDLVRDAGGKAVGFRTVSRDITARKLLEDELRQSEERYRTILEEMEDAYYEVAIGGNFTFVNDQTSRDTGYSREELIGMNYRELTPLDEHKAIYGAYLKVYTTGVPNKGHAHKIIRKDGSILFVEAAISLLKDKQGQIIGFRSVSRDVTRRRLLEEALAASEEKYRTILEQIQDSYYEVDLAGHFLFANEATCRNMGMPLEKLIGSNYQVMIPDDEKATVYATFAHVHDTGMPNKGFAHKIIMADGSTGYAEVSISPLKDKNGETIGFRCVSRDVTFRKQMEQLLANMATHDFLTELPNRVLLIDRFEVAMAQAQRKHIRLAVMSLDLDRFKEVNDTLGHSAGDEVLKYVAEKLVGLVRSSDTVARLGGDEFLLLLQEIHDLDDATTIADKIVNSFKEPFTMGGHQLLLSASIGIALFPDDGNDLETLMKKSDASMYNSKRRGGSQYKVYNTIDHKEFSQ
jgi:diguanylate cyclase (GGDEF)-like protein/PAS domain S-box-containing protein